jgi:hypothetical protein
LPVPYRVRHCVIHWYADYLTLAMGHLWLLTISRTP